MLFETVEVENARYPFPIMVAIHVKPGMNELECYDSIEFSPFEVGFAKYGVSMKTKDFHCRFYAGKVISQHPEPPLKHFQSVFGSAHTIDVKTLMQDMADIANDGEWSSNQVIPDVTDMKEKVMAGVNSKEWRAPQIWNPMKGLQFEKIGTQSSGLDMSGNISVKYICWN